MWTSKNYTIYLTMLIVLFLIFLSILDDVENAHARISLSFLVAANVFWCTAATVSLIYAVIGEWRK